MTTYAFLPPEFARQTRGLAAGSPYSAGLAANNAVTDVGRNMHDPSYYRTQSERARRLARAVVNYEVQNQLERVAEDYEDIAVDLETGAIEIRHAELMPQNNRRR